MLTGESMPVDKKIGDAVIGATINKSGTFQYRATKVGADTALAQIVKLVQEAQNSKAPAQLLADRASQWLVLAAVAVGILTFVVWYWWIGQSLLFALSLTITVFVIACPDALGLATPMAIMVGTGLGAMNGILFKNASALEDATKLDVVIFDKTGTLTMGHPEVVDLSLAAGASEEQLLSAAAAVEGGSDHPLAQAILRRAANVKAPKATEFKNLEGKGAQAQVDGKPVLLGNKLLMTENRIDLGELGAKSEELQGAGRTVVHLAVDGYCRCSETDRYRSDKGTARAWCRSRHAHRRQSGHGRPNRKESGDWPSVRQRVAWRQGKQGQGATGPRQESRHGRRRRE
jgi:Cu2+-exporting ATPase